MPKKSVVVELTEKQAKFVESRARGAGRVVAAREAGYKNPRANGGKIEKFPAVQEELQRQFELNRQDANLTRSDVIEGILEAIRQAKMLADPGTQIMGYRELAKICGFNAPEVKKIELTAGQEVRRNQLEQLSDSELLELSKTDYHEVAEDDDA